MLRQFLESSSVHGLRYLSSEAGSAASRCAWAAAVATCVAAAAVINYHNVLNWRNSPTMVTSVERVPVKNLPFMPRVMICPHYQDANVLLVNLAKKYPDVLGGETGRKFSRLLNSMAVAAAAKRDYDYHWNGAASVRPLLQQCKRPYNSSSEECRLVQTLLAGADRFGKADFLPFLTGYLVSRAEEAKEEGGRAAELEDLQIKAEEKFNASLRLEDAHLLLDKYGAVYDHIRLYGRIFPVFVEGTDRDVHPLKKLQEYQPLRYLHELDGKTWLSALGHLLSADHDLGGQKFQTFAEALLAELVNLQLGINFTGIADAADFVDDFVYDREYRFLNVLRPRQTAGKEDDVADGKDEVDVADDGKAELVRELLEMGTASAAGDDGILTSCRRIVGRRRGSVKEECSFVELQTEAGPCYASNSGPGGEVIIGGAGGVESGLVFMLDATPRFEFPVASSPLSDAANVDPSFSVAVAGAVDRSVGHRAADGVSAELNTDRNFELKSVHLSVAVRSVSRATEDFRRLSVNARGCLYPDEGEDRDGTTIYSQANCLLDCAWETAAERCGCVPWFLAQKRPDKAMCRADGNRCFKKIVDDRDEDQSPCSAGCLPDCESADLTVTVLRQPKTDEDEEMSDERTEAEAERAGPTARRILKDLSPVRLYVESKTTLLVVRTASATLVDVVSNVGGTLGLFCGFSILSGMEAVYWAWKGAADAWKRNKGRGRR